ncbi:DUF3048 domain-containing protein [Candidatus Poriferisodalis sp.]|uniref:DUF3048 domain-containing protein n=1 Tax=Candidatus Poriferisodalis sp. TaxID=3101277 RepID=UPI003B010B64
MKRVCMWPAEAGRRLGLALLGPLVLSACASATVPAATGGQAESSAPTDAAAAPATAAPPDNEPPTAVTAPVTSAAVTTSAATAAPLFTAAFTGLPTPTEITRPAAVVKIDNHPRALPQWGINQADVVYEELVEARLTRFAAIFHSTDADVVGPVRSARTGDFALLSNLNRPIFVTSGANAYTARALRSVEAVKIIDGARIAKDVFERSSRKSAPHNLITGTARIYAAGGDQGGTPPTYFRFRNGDASSQPGTPVSGVDIDFGQIKASYRWDAAVGGWARTQNGKDHTDFDGVRVAPENVIVQFVRYRQSPANAATPEPVLTGSGEAWMLTDGTFVRGTWERASELDVTVFRSDNALIVPLTPGRTWIALAKAGSAQVVA